MVLKTAERNFVDCEDFKSIGTGVEKLLKISFYGVELPQMPLTVKDSATLTLVNWDV